MMTIALRIQPLEIMVVVEYGISLLHRLIEVEREAYSKDVPMKLLLWVLP
jgi:hypothetical protein